MLPMDREPLAQAGHGRIAIFQMGGRGRGREGEREEGRERGREEGREGDLRGPDRL